MVCFSRELAVASYKHPKRSSRVSIQETLAEGPLLVATS